MSTPRYTAEASLYRTHRLYQTSRYRPSVNSRGQIISPIWPAMKAEEIEIHGCLPGYTLWESGGEWGCTLVEPPTGGGDGGGPSGGGPSDGGGGGGGDNLPGIEDPKCPRNGYNPDYDPEICKACRGECDIAHPITPCKGSK